jgi:hypothetical protein
MKVTFFWDVAPCSLVEVYLMALMMEAANMPETAVNFYQTTMRSISDDNHIQNGIFYKIK